MDMSNFANDVTTTTVTIANSGTVSTAAQLFGMRLVGIVTPSALTGTAMTFQASADGSTYTAMYDTDGNAISYTVAASRWIPVTADVFGGVPYIKVVSGSSEAAARTITLVVKPL